MLDLFFGEPHSLRRKIAFCAVAGMVAGILAAIFNLNLTITSAVVVGISLVCAGLHWKIDHQKALPKPSVVKFFHISYISIISIIIVFFILIILSEFDEIVTFFIPQQQSYIFYIL